MDREQWEEVVKESVSGGLKGVAKEQVPAKVIRVMTGPVMRRAVRTTYVAAWRREMVSGAAEHAMLRASATTATKGLGQLATIGKVAGPVAGAAVAPFVEIAHVLYEDKVKGEVRTGEDYRNAAIRGTASGVAGAGATASLALVVGVLCPPAAPFLAAGAGIAASSVVNKLMKENM